MMQSEEYLTKFGIRPTKHRMELAGLLFEDNEPRHFTAEALFMEAQAAGYKISQATVYNCLHIFCQAGLIREIAIEGQRSFYDTNTNGHPHFYQSETSEIKDAPTDMVDVEIRGDIPEGMEVSGVDVIIRLREIAPKN